ncbi:gliding motility-associated C-terminal domain-containing protein [Flavobacterium flevense]|uniref:T9SS type B sorting domain-containing protein n=1 Tax=Flavobacterium flevense TaxID=983 RepID=UPI00091A8F1F|nr:T9SS type B sorting domain-containing protein [Flavobacterium flevense]SHL75552.1 gliding motility-associated C-terminal domain-containing protein [Flavobacterium flevense]
MNLKYISCLLFFFLSTLQVWSQFPLGKKSYGDPVSYFDFGFGYSADGPELYYGMTNYSYVRGEGLPVKGSYMVRNSLTLPEFNEPIGDISGGYGYMLLVDSGNSNFDYFFKNTITGLCPGATYEISAMFRSLLKFDPAVIDKPTGIVVTTVEDTNGNILNTFYVSISPYSYGYWRQSTFEFTPRGVSTVIIRMKNFSIELDKQNPIAVDEFLVRPVNNKVYADINSTSLYSDVCINSINSNIVLTASYKIETGLPKNGYQWQVSSEENNYVWTDIPGANRIQYSFTPTTEGNYNFRVGNADIREIDNINCRVYSDLVTANVMMGPVKPVVQVTQPSCDVTTATISITEPKGLLYSIDGENYQPEMVFSNLSGGNYTVSVKSGVCVSVTDNVLVNYDATTGLLPTAVISQPLSCIDAFGTITITSPDAQYSFDNGQTWQDDNVKSGLISGNYVIKTRDSRLCQSLPLSINVAIPKDYPPTPSVTVTQPDCYNRMGTIEILDDATAYSFDGGITEGITKIKSNLVPGTYQVLIKNNLGCSSFVANEVVIRPYVSTEPLPVVANSSQSFCVQDSKKLNDITISGTNIKWYDAPGFGNLLSGTTVLTSRTYYASQTISMCESERIPVLVTVHDTAAPTGNSVQSFCSTQNAAIRDLEAIGTGIVWYDLAANGTALSASVPLIDGGQYYASQTLDGCESVGRLRVSVSIGNPTVVVNDVSASFCDDFNDGVERVDLVSYNRAITLDASTQIRFYPTLLDAQNQNNSVEIISANNYSLKMGVTTLYARVDSNDKCYQVVKIVLTLFSEPVITIGDNVTLCENSSVTIDAGSGFDSYLWSTGATSKTIIVSELGSYWVTVIQKHGSVICSSTKDFSVVLSNVATISEIKIQDWTDADNVIIVELTNSSIGDYEYSLDAINYQESNTFSGLRSGDYIVYVRDKNNCGIVNQEVFVLSYPKYFTPNGDGYNDSWSVRFSASEPTLNTKIFDRYGKIIKELNGNSSSWDGNFNGKELPATDYWFVVTRENGKVLKGHFSLKR